ncbi:hypothetical protein [Pseudomonas sp. GL-B-19]|uniref:hypothetical protein n=1 Tax=Pseudomonas sp. GL-B-19 TaxID=2832393 RepID=UPI001CBE45CA|nr:hypothetical protein [Pseudomonas sp. GL-B-19]
MQKPTRELMSFVRSLPPVQGRKVRRNVLFVSITLSLIALLTVMSNAKAAGGAYVVDDAAIRPTGC